MNFTQSPGTNPFDDFDFTGSSSTGAASQPISISTGGDDFAGFFNPTPTKKIPRTSSFTGLAPGEGLAADFDDWSGFSNTPPKSPSVLLSPRVKLAAKRASARRTREDNGGLLGITSPRSRTTSRTAVPPQPPQPPQPPPPQLKVSTPRSSSDRRDAQEDLSKTSVLRIILQNILQFSKYSSKSAQQSLALHYAELDKFVSNPQYRNCGQAVDGLLQVYTTLKQLEHDLGEMDKRLIVNYEHLKVLAVQLGGQQADIFQKCQIICEEIRGQAVTHDPYNASSPERTPKRGSVRELETQYGLGASDVIVSLDSMNKSSGDSCTFSDKELTGFMSLRKTEGVAFMRKWTDVFFVLNNDRLVAFKDNTDIRRAKPILDVRIHGKMQIGQFKPYPTKGGILMSSKFQELDQTLGGGGVAEWNTLFKFGSKNKMKFELWKRALSSAITYQRKKDPMLAIKRSFSFGEN
jgi:hypothetical protein